MGSIYAVGQEVWMDICLRISWHELRLSLNARIDCCEGLEVPLGVVRDNHDEQSRMGQETQHSVAKGGTTSMGITTFRNRVDADLRAN
jgi:hypothetical protein